MKKKILSILLAVFMLVALLPVVAFANNVPRTNPGCMDGSVSCLTCRGVGCINCPICHKEGKIECPNCRNICDEYCLTCRDSHIIRYRTCNGERQRECRTYDGTEGVHSHRNAATCEYTGEKRNLGSHNDEPPANGVMRRLRQNDGSAPHQRHGYCVDH